MASGLETAVAKGDSKPASDEGEGSDAELSSFVEHADDVYDAIKKGDRRAFSDALEKAIHACYNEGE